MKRIVIIGASSGIGKAVALRFLESGWRVGLAARNVEALKEISRLYPDMTEVEHIDVTSEDAPEKLISLINKLKGVDVYFHCSGIGSQNLGIDSNIEKSICYTNVVGFSQMIDTAYNYFKTRRIPGHIAIVSSVAGTKGLGVSPAYSATKRYQNIYLECIEQLSHMQGVDLSFTDIRPGFVKTPLLNDGNNYPLLMDVEKVATSIVKALLRKKRVVIIDWRYRILVWMWKVIPRQLWVRMPVKTN